MGRVEGRRILGKYTFLPLPLGEGHMRQDTVNEAISVPAYALTGNATEFSSPFPCRNGGRAGDGGLSPDRATNHPVYHKMAHMWERAGAASHEPVEW